MSKQKPPSRDKRTKKLISSNYLYGRNFLQTQRESGLENFL